MAAPFAARVALFLAQICVETSFGPDAPLAKAGGEEEGGGAIKARARALATDGVTGSCSSGDFVP